MAAVRAGATGFLLKNAEADELRHAVKTVAAGRTYVSSAAVARLVDQVTAESARLSSNPHAPSRRHPRGRALDPDGHP